MNVGYAMQSVSGFLIILLAVAAAGAFILYKNSKCRAWGRHMLLIIFGKFFHNNVKIAGFFP